jgi:hypothetical protein
MFRCLLHFGLPSCPDGCYSFFIFCGLRRPLRRYASSFGFIPLPVSPIRFRFDCSAFGGNGAAVCWNAQRFQLGWGQVGETQKPAASLNAINNAIEVGPEKLGLNHTAIAIRDGLEMVGELHDILTIGVQDEEQRETSKLR